jgi:hypothetical protein
MSAFAGVFIGGLNRDQLRDTWLTRIRRSVHETSKGLEHAEYRDSGFGVLKYDNDAFRSPGHLYQPGSRVLVVAGHPHLDETADEARIEHVRKLAQWGPSGTRDALRTTRGCFAMALFSAETSQLILSSDFLGLRPLYYAPIEQGIVFSTNVRVLRGLGDDVTGKPNWSGAVEVATLGFPVSNGTAFERIHRVPGGHVLTFNSDGAQVAAPYWSAETLEIREAVGDESRIREHTRAAFVEAVTKRLGKEDSRVLAFLSGGLDSRSIVAVLRQLGVDVETLNHANTESQDCAFGRVAAAALQTHHTEMVWDRRIGAFVLLPKWREKLAESGRSVPRMNLVWSGDGGSVTLGHVYISDTVVAKMRAGDDSGAIDQLVRELHWEVPVRVLRRNSQQRFAKLTQTALLEQLRRIQCSDQGRRLHILLMLREQSHHLDHYYESIYLHQTEMQLPFFDRRFVESVLSAPIEPFLRHHLYNALLAELSPIAANVPWQAYPGHEPGPDAGAGAGDDALVYQWSLDSATRTRLRRKTVNETRRYLAHKRLADSPISRRRLTLAWIATALGVRDVSYALRFAQSLLDEVGGQRATDEA